MWTAIRFNGIHTECVFKKKCELCERVTLRMQQTEKHGEQDKEVISGITSAFEL